MSSLAQISADELHHLLRLMDPHRRLARLKPVDVPTQPNAAQRAIAALAAATQPAIQRANTLWEQINPFDATRDDDDDDE